MIKAYLAASLLFLVGAGCTTKPNFENKNTEQPLATPPAIEQIELVNPTTTEAKLIVARTFTVDEIETNGDGLKNWFRDLARANVAGKKILVRIPVSHVFGFGCETPTNYCASTQTSGCFGPYLDLKGETGQINQASKQCDQMCGQKNDSQGLTTDAIGCSAEFRDSQCSTLWDVEGYVTAASRAPEKSVGDGGSCGQGELVYDFKVTRVIKKIQAGYDDEFNFIEYSSK